MTGRRCADRAQLDFAALQQELSALPQDKFVVCFYDRNGKHGQIEWMDALAARLRERGFVTVGLTSPGHSGKMRFGATDYTAQVDTALLEELNRINVFIVTDEDRYFSFPAASRVLGVLHGTLNLVGDSHLGGFIHNMPRLDGWLCPFVLSEKSKKMIRKLWTGFVSPAFSWRKSPLFQIITAGYPRLALLKQRLDAIRIEPDSILYAPAYEMESQDMWGRNQSRDALPVVDALLKAFPEYKVIYRPHVTNIHHSAVETVKLVYADEPRFILDENPEREPVFARSSLLITNVSLIRKSFSYSTLRPAICYQPEQEIAGVNKFEDGAFVTASLDNLIATVKYCLDNKEELRNRIENYRNEVMPPPESAFDDIANLLEDFYHDKPVANSVAIRRVLPPYYHREIQIIAHIREVERENAFEAAIAAAVATGFNRNIRLLAAFGLHTCYLLTPDMYFYDLDARVCREFYGAAFSSRRYGDIDPQYIIKLYKDAIVEYEANEDRIGWKFAKGLLEEFEESLRTKSPEL